MRYPKEHREQKRQEILRAAARLFRARGYDGVGIEAIMEACDLTRGGFYGYFRSKEELFAECLAGEHDFVARLEARDGTSPATLTQQALEVVDSYLGAENRDAVGRGCSIAALAVDAARSTDTARSTYGDAVLELAHQFERGLAQPDSPDPRALATIALCVGSLLLSRAVADERLADRIEEAGRCGARLLLAQETLPSA